MTLREAIGYLLDDFQLEDCVEIVREDAKADDAFTGLSWEHPKVQRFRQACTALRTALDAPEAPEGV